MWQPWSIPYRCPSGENPGKGLSLAGSLQLPYFRNLLRYMPKPPGYSQSMAEILEPGLSYPTQVSSIRLLERASWWCGLAFTQDCTYPKFFQPNPLLSLTPFTGASLHCSLSLLMPPLAFISPRHFLDTYVCTSVCLPEDQTNTIQNERD